MFSDAMITKEVVEWVKALTANGLFTVNAHGKTDLAPSIKEVLRVLHDVLAGGQAKVSVQANGCGCVKSELDQKLTAALASVGGTDLPDEYQYGP